MKSRIIILFSLFLSLFLAGLVSANPVGVYPSWALSPIFAFFVALVLTIVFEFIVYIIGIRKYGVGKLLLYSLVINCLTMPLANFFAYLLKIGSSSYSLLYFIIIELVVVGIESVLLCLLTKRAYWKMLIISFIANLITATIGLFLIVLF
jgi:hypothetical protein